jgi:hypothetical protein
MQPTISFDQDKSQITQPRQPRQGTTQAWTRHERLRILWHRLRGAVQEMNYATRRMTELQTRLP